MRIAALVILISSLVQLSSCIRYSNNIVLAGFQPAVASETSGLTLSNTGAANRAQAIPRTADSASRPHTYLALGDSYTIGQSVDITDRYPVQLVKKLNADGVNYADPEIIATSGWTTANLLNAIRDKKADTPYDLVTLLIGVNNQ